MSKKLEAQNKLSPDKQVEAGQGEFGTEHGVPSVLTVKEDELYKPKKRRPLKKKPNNRFESVLSIPFGQPVDKKDIKLGDVIVRPKVGRVAKDVIDKAFRGKTSRRVVTDQSKEKLVKPKPLFDVAIIFDLSQPGDLTKTWLLKLHNSYPFKLEKEASVDEKGQYQRAHVFLGEPSPAVLLKTKVKPGELAGYHIYRFGTGTTMNSSDDQVGYITQTPFLAERLKRETKASAYNSFRLIWPEEVTFVRRDSFGGISAATTIRSGQNMTLGYEKQQKIEITDLLFGRNLVQP